MRSRRQTWGILGAILGAGAPLGYGLFRAVEERRVPSPAWLGRELRRRRGTYAWLGVSTAVALAWFGRAVGGKEDALRASEREAVRTRDRFSRLVSRSLRAPLERILVETSVLREQGSGEATDHAATDEVRVPCRTLDRVHDTALGLVRATAEFDDVVQLERGRLALDRRPLALADAAGALVERIRARLGPHPVGVRVEGRPPPALVDPARLDQILEILLANAARYSAEHEPIVVTVRPAGAGVELSVTDRGVGIAAGDLPRLFERDFQMERAQQRPEEEGGLGLGLYLARGLVEAHGGAISVASVPGRGTTFDVRLPGAPRGAVPSPIGGERVAPGGASPAVRDFMTADVSSVAPGDRATAVRSSFARRALAQLPVLDGATAVGLLDAARLCGCEDDATVGQLMSPWPMVVSPDTPVEDAARVMARRRLGAVVVMDGPRLVGQLTVGDALRALEQAS